MRGTGLAQPGQRGFLGRSEVAFLSKYGEWLMPKRRTGPADHARALDALTREIQRLQDHSAKVVAEIAELRQHISYLYVNLAPLDPRNKPSKGRKAGKAVKAHIRGK